MAETAVSRNVVEHPGGFNSFRAPLADDFEGDCFLAEVIRIGDHAHVRMYTGNQPRKQSRRDQSPHRGEAGVLRMHWHRWLRLREIFGAQPDVFIAEVAEPTADQVQHFYREPIEKGGTDVRS